MKATVLYYSQSGNTKAMAEKILEGMNSVAGLEAKAFAIDQLDEAWLNESKCVVLGTPTYYADVAGKIKVFMETLGKYQLGGKLGGAFSTAGYVYGGGDLALQSVLAHLMFFGMMVYSGGRACGAPPIHLGPVAVNGQNKEMEETFVLYGQRMATKATELFK